MARTSTLWRLVGRKLTVPAYPRETVRLKVNIAQLCARTSIGGSINLIKGANCGGCLVSSLEWSVCTSS